jgi:flagellar motor protein MotB
MKHHTRECVQIKWLIFSGAQNLMPDMLSLIKTIGGIVLSLFGVYGHSDASGPSDYNLQLSESRALSVTEYLVKALGINSNRLRAKGFGETRLKYPQAPYSRENRRVEIVNLSPGMIQIPDSQEQSITQ